MRKSLLNIAAGLGMLFTTQADAHDNVQTKKNDPPTPIVQTEQKQDYMAPNYSKKDLNAKLERLYNNIRGSNEDVEYVKGLLQKMANYGIGQPGRRTCANKSACQHARCEDSQHGGHHALCTRRHRFDGLY